MTKQYIYYKTCITCNVSKELTGSNFRRNTYKDTSRYRKQCKACDLEQKIQEHWRENKLKCFICNEYKKEEEFSNSKANKHRNGKDRRCNHCRSIESKKRREALTGQHQINRCIKERYLGARDRAKRKRVLFNLTEEDVTDLLNRQRYKCALTGTTLTFELGNGRVPTNMSIDRIDSGRGYTINNIQLICSAVNQFKNELPQDYFISMCRKIVTYHENKNN